MPRQKITLAAVQAAIDVHVAKGTMERLESGSYMMVPRERLTLEQVAWFDLRAAVEDAGSIEAADPKTLRKLLHAWIDVASKEQLSKFAIHFPNEGNDRFDLRHA